MKICIAIDNLSQNFDIKTFTKPFPQNIIVKIGLEYFTKFGYPSISHDVFLDLKFFDIPNTVSHAVENVVKYNPKYLTIHALGEKDMIKAAVSEKSSTKILCVTHLTSTHTSVDEICKLTEISLQNGADGVVCSANEAQILRQKFGNDFEIVTPGIRPSWYNKSDDQLRIATPRHAFEMGSSMIVIGRPVTQAENPLEVIKKIQEEIKPASSN